MTDDKPGLRHILINVEGHKIRLSLFLGGGDLESDLKSDDPDDEAYNDSIDGLEALILAHACAGVDVTEKKYITGIETALEAISNNV